MSNTALSAGKEWRVSHAVIQLISHCRWVGVNWCWCHCFPLQLTSDPRCPIVLSTLCGRVESCDPHSHGHFPVAHYASGLAFSGKKNWEELSWYWAMLPSGIKIKKEEGAFVLIINARCRHRHGPMDPWCLLQTFSLKTSSPRNALVTIRSQRSGPLPLPALAKRLPPID